MSNTYHVVVPQACWLADRSFLPLQGVGILSAAIVSLVTLSCFHHSIVNYGEGPCRLLPVFVLQLQDTALLNVDRHC